MLIISWTQFTFSVIFSKKMENYNNYISILFLYCLNKILFNRKHYYALINFTVYFKNGLRVKMFFNECNREKFP